jgi:NADH:ubiquinone oxidoreductase subunit 5 (subunit L)/multisubunit Na+/H+ antiporter MnhA subunit
MLPLMLLLAVFTPFINFLVFAVFSTFVNRKQLVTYTVTSMGALLLFLLTYIPQVMSGVTQTASLGV